MNAYHKRVIDGELELLLQGLPAVAINGPKGVGKTASAERIAASTLRLDQPGQLATLRGDRSVIDRLEAPVLIDEWQLDPPVWDAVRRSIDARRTPGRFLLTGSANPRDARIHSGAGRIVNLRMRPLSFAERHPEVATVSLTALVRGTAGMIGGHTSITLADYTQEILASGFPGIRDDAPTFRRRQLSSYLDQVLHEEVPALGNVIRRPQSLRDWLHAYAAASSATASYETIADAVSPSSRPARGTIIDYRDALGQLWLLDPVPAWAPRGLGIERLGKGPKHQLADPALAARLLGVSERTLLGANTDVEQRPEYQRLFDGPLLGALFESLVTLSLRVYAQPLELDVSHLRTHRGEREVDLILSDERGGVIAIEVKLAEAIGDRDVRHLTWLHDKLGDRLIDRIVVTTGSYAYRREDGIAVVPLALLGP